MQNSECRVGDSSNHEVLVFTSKHLDLTIRHSEFCIRISKFLLSFYQSRVTISINHHLPRLHKLPGF